jgi:regulator of replication initiation timing
VTTAETDSAANNDGDSANIAPFLRRARRIREDEVRKTADALLLDGERPTVERVRMRLGRGSPNTIALFLDRWWSALGARLRDLPGQELPSVPEPVSNALIALWNQAIDQARALLKDSLAQQVREAEDHRATLEVQAAHLERERTEFARERAALEQTVSIVQQQLGQANDRHRADGARIEALQAETVRVTDLQLALQRDLAESHARLEQARVEHQEMLRGVQERADSAERHWLGQVDQARQATLIERQRAQALEKERLAEVARLRATLEASHTECADIRIQLGRLQEARAVLVAENEQWKERLRRQEAQAEAALASLKEAQAEALKRVELLHAELRSDLTRSRQQRMTPGSARTRRPSARTPKADPNA